MADDSATKESVNRLVSAFRKELDSFVQHLDSDHPSEAAASAASSSAAARNRAASRNGGSDARKRVVLQDDNHIDEDEDDGKNNDVVADDPPAPVQTPYRTVTSTSKATGDEQPQPLAPHRTPRIRTAPTITPATSASSSALPPSSSAALFSGPNWKANVNDIVDFIESKEARLAAFQQENNELREKVDTLTRDYSILQQDYQQMQTRKVKTLTEENDVLREMVEELREAALADKQQMQEECNEFRAHLREAREQRDAVERQNDRLHDRIREYEQRFGPLSTSPVAMSRSVAARSLLSGAGAGAGSEGNYNNGGGSGGGGGGTTARRTYHRSTSTPGEALVRDLHETTALDTEYLSPLSDILDRRLGRTPKNATARTPSSRNQFYS